MTGKSFGIYIHIPFCERKCRYCDFLSFNAGDEEKENYVKALIREINESGFAGEKADTVFFGGGTPSVLSAKHLADILESIRKNFRLSSDAEVSTECNPKSADDKKLKAYREAGFNRLSMGVQSMRDDELEVLGRIHGESDVYESFKAARQAGFENINLDLMTGLPGQDLKSFLKTLRKIIQLNPEHISVYSLMLEEGTPLHKNINDCAPLPDEEEERNIYHGAVKALEEKGYYRYEISNFAKKGFECRHNLKYWELKEYLGFGIGAASFADGRRFSNTKDLGTYITGKDIKLYEDVHKPDKREIMGEFMFLGLRKIEGIKLSDFKEMFDMDIEDVFGSVISEHVKDGVLKKTAEGFALTERGIDVSNFVMSDFVL